MQANACERDVERLSWFPTCDRKKASSQSEGFARLSASSSSAGVALIVLSQFSPTSSRFIFKFMPNISIGVKKWISSTKKKTRSRSSGRQIHRLSGHIWGWDDTKKIVYFRSLATSTSAQNAERLLDLSDGNCLDVCRM